MATGITLLRMSDAGGTGLEPSTPGPLFAEFSIRKFIVEERDHQPVALWKLLCPKDGGGLGIRNLPVRQCPTVFYLQYRRDLP